MELDRSGGISSRSAVTAVEGWRWLSGDVTRNLLAPWLALGRLNRAVDHSIEACRSDFPRHSAALFAARSAGRKNVIPGTTARAHLPVERRRPLLVDLIYERLHDLESCFRISRSSRRACDFWARGSP